MIYQVFSILDVRVGCYNPPYFAKSEAEGERMFEASRMDRETMINKFPNDFVLVRLGQYDDLSGMFENHPPQIAEGVSRVAGPTVAAN